MKLKTGLAFWLGILAILFGIAGLIEWYATEPCPPPCTCPEDEKNCTVQTYKDATCVFGPGDKVCCFMRGKIV